MVSVFRLAISGCSMAGILYIALPGHTHAPDPLTSRVQTKVLNTLAARELNTDRCIPTQRMTDLLRSHPAVARQILEFAGRNLAARDDRLRDDCTCATDLAVATIHALPDLAGPLRRVLEDRYPECDSQVATSMERLLIGIAPGAGTTSGTPGSTPLLSRPNDEGCQDMSAAGCDLSAKSSSESVAPKQISALSRKESVRGFEAAADLSSDLQVEILEALEAGPERENQCISANAFSTLIKDNPEMALAIMEFADVKLSEKGRLLGDECVCPIELATATVSAVPELTIPVRRALDDRYPECTEPAAAGHTRKHVPEPPCFETASPSC